MENCIKEYVYVDGLPFCIINGNHNIVIKHVKDNILPFLYNGNRVLIVNELKDKYYHYEVYYGDLRRLNCVCLYDLDIEHHKLYKDFF